MEVMTVLCHIMTFGPFLAHTACDGGPVRFCGLLVVHMSQSVAVSVL